MRRRWSGGGRVRVTMCGGVVVVRGGSSARRGVAGRVPAYIFVSILISQGKAGKGNGHTVHPHQQA
jgi:hypothetical protein